jgi:hypothetical protein
MLQVFLFIFRRSSKLIEARFVKPDITTDEQRFRRAGSLRSWC